MHPNGRLVERFYDAFSRRDAETMATCYHREAVFSDPAFPHLEGDRIGGMWAMLCERGEDLQLDYDSVVADDTTGSARWRARYTFGRTGRAVDNRIQASFEFRDGAIVRHRDDFDFYRWSRMALGAPGWLLGWTPLLRAKVQGQAGAQLDRYLKRRG
ncbi:MAG: nuclear transport factor 2 family protein [Acidobacteriota bacterium]